MQQLRADREPAALDQAEVHLDANAFFDYGQPDHLAGTVRIRPLGDGEDAVPGQRCRRPRKVRAFRRTDIEDLAVVRAVRRLEVADGYWPGPHALVAQQNVQVDPYRV